MADLGLYDEVRRASQSNDDLMKHIGLVKRVALHLKTRLPNFMELDELIQVGTIGLIEAAKSFDDKKGVEFEVFARTRIRGAIIDQVRKLSYLPRSAIVNIRDHNQATALCLANWAGNPHKVNSPISWVKTLKTSTKNGLMPIDFKLFH